ncbi:hypothetical protein DBZ36_01100 [Alginatibacterium sediminis]|uniref:PD-(D/E)XK nuclease superfamily protein n=1 Tax=Alginatibacterium sediminis TaxID=2164068 RepID=A0A420ENU9_9ALTE|nr:PD-(D/E)XK nuclease family protein [Alginatibacterium sediminis]RKF22274.1 hypothetical protein DBZ36_01100 [Alginatibacterium sediminis]
MSNSLLVNISKYASSHQTSPIENFITEAFAWLLRNDEQVREALCIILQSKGSDQGLSFEQLAESDSLDTQVNFNGKYPDMLWYSKDDQFCVIFEHKVWSELHHKQLHNYRAYAEEHLNKRHAIVLISAHVGQHRQNPNIALCWHEVAQEIQKIDSKNGKLDWIRSEFVDLLKNNGLVDVSPINPLSVAYYNEVKRLDKQLTNISERSRNLSWPLLNQENATVFTIPENRKINQWGRVGLTFSSFVKDNPPAWKPGLFFGFVMDGSDHLIEDLLKEGPIAAVVLSINQKHFLSLKDKGYYDRFVAHLRKQIPKGWHISDRTEKGNRINKWHPLIIYRNLSEFIGDANTLDKQQQTYFRQMSEMQELILGCDSFQSFCNELQDRSMG